MHVLFSWNTLIPYASSVSWVDITKCLQILCCDLVTICDSIGDASNTTIQFTLLSLSQYNVITSSVSSQKTTVHGLKPILIQVSQLMQFVSVWFVCVCHFDYTQA